MGVVGGDIVRSPVFFVTTALAGVTQRAPLLRSTASTGDAVAVTGWLGSSAGGLRLMLECPDATGDAAEFLRQAHRRPAPAVRAGQVLAGAGIATAMDVSDGLVDDLGKLCGASGVSARVEASMVPTHPFLVQQFPEEHLRLALGGAEDYVLLFTGPPEMVQEVVSELGEGCSVIGSIISAGDAGDAGDAGGVGGVGWVSVVDGEGRELPVPDGGWDHFG